MRNDVPAMPMTCNAMDQHTALITCLYETRVKCSKSLQSKEEDVFYSATFCSRHELCDGASSTLTVISYMNYEEGQACRALKMTVQMAREDCLRAMYLF